MEKLIEWGLIDIRVEENQRSIVRWGKIFLLS